MTREANRSQRIPSAPVVQTADCNMAYSIPSILVAFICTTLCTVQISTAPSRTHTEIMPVPRRGCAAPLFVVSTMMLVLLLGASFAEEDCIVGPDGTQVCNETDNRNDDCVDQMGTTACIDLLYGSTTTDACIEQFPTLRQQCAIMCHLCHVLTTEQLTSSERYELSRLYSAEFPQIIEGQQAAETYRYLQDVDEYMYETVYQDEEFSKVRTACQNQHELCTFWAMRKCDIVRRPAKKTP